ncbi:homeobox protein HOX1A-like [Magnolia sinica]|uniref:homeobox protein HOX1A-like n=1 Tax=Magnolia sinica TaxID=86752 RepID=UPI002657C3D3|nr:homeobox protein HOX1A-like [Magnolia sinica]XP_058070078.1 homeobox protein HOX1A-like [Magnolia sinica]
MCVYDTKHMDAASAQESCQAMNCSRPMKNSEQQQNEHDSKATHKRSANIVLARSDSLGIEQLRPSLESAMNVESNLGRGDMPQSALKNSRGSARKGKKVSSKLGSRKYILRSSSDGVRVLRSRSNGACKSKTTLDANANSVPLNTERGKKRKKKKKRINREKNDELSRIRNRVRYLLARMSYEQSLIDAYSGEGWKGQSAEKLRPEKELQRATSEILRCKLKIRDIFQNLDNICSEGKFQESLFDSEGQIDSDDIFCAKCGSKEFSANNDIILCDGICDRGFHQKCLIPPLLNEEIPPGDESWLCPGCNCKVDCVDLLNDIQETNLSIEDKWEEVFPEAAASAAGDKQYDDLGLPSDDSEDDDYDPDGPDLSERVPKEGSSSEELDSSSISDDSSTSASEEQHERSGFSSDDSEDKDYDPDVPDVDNKVQKEGSSSDESEFTSDSSGSSASSHDNASSSSDEVPVGSSRNHSDPVDRLGKGRSKMSPEKRKPLNSELISLLEPDPSGKIAPPISGKRHCVRLDYKKLHDETYGNIPSDLSDDEDWTEMSTPRREKSDNVIPSKRNARTLQNEQFSTKAQSTPAVKDMLPKPIIDQVGVAANIPNRNTCEKLEVESTNHSVAKLQKDNPKSVSPNRNTCEKLEVEGTNHSVAKQLKDNPKSDTDSSAKKATTSGSRSFSLAVSQRLSESLMVNEYPDRVTIENLSKELGITVQQVKKWFENARRSLRLKSNREETKAENRTLDNDTVISKTNGKDTESRGIIVNSASNGSEVMRSNKADVVKPTVTQHGVGERKWRKQVVSRSYWNSAKHESRKRRMDKLSDGAPDVASRANMKLTKGKERDSAGVQRPQEKRPNR